MRASFLPVTGIRWYRTYFSPAVAEGNNQLIFIVQPRRARGPDVLARQVFMCCCLWQPVIIGAGIAGLFVIIVAAVYVRYHRAVAERMPADAVWPEDRLFSAGKYPVCGTVIGAPVVAVPAGGRPSR